ncbi:MAG: hypothetical protein JWM36_3821 [Hyphomicrobiales bacterium]|nr:hypothetical protein [Hyphomicrobiales bacterium]
MTPSAAKKGPRRYRYYMSCLLAQGRAAEAGSVKRMSAPEAETFKIEGCLVVLAALREPVSGRNCLYSGKIQGKFPKHAEKRPLVDEKASVFQLPFAKFPA